MKELFSLKNCELKETYTVINYTIPENINTIILEVYLGIYQYETHQIILKRGGGGIIPTLISGGIQNFPLKLKFEFNGKITVGIWGSIPNQNLSFVIYKFEF